MTTLTGILKGSVSPSLSGIIAGGAGGVVPSFDYGDVTGLELEMINAPENLTLSGSDITAWTDKQGNAVTVVGTPSIVGGIPKFELYDRLDVDYTLPTGGYTMYALIEVTVNPADQQAWYPAMMKCDSDDQSLYISSLEPFFQVKTNSNGGNERPSVNSDDFFLVGRKVLARVEVGLDKTSMYVDGLLIQERVRSTVATALTTSATTQLMVYFEGSLNAMLVYNGIPSEADAALIENKLRSDFAGYDDDILIRDDTLNFTTSLGSKQGIASDGTNFYTNSGTQLFKLDTDYSILVSNTNAKNDAGITDADHMGDICIVGNEVFVALEDYPNAPDWDNQHIAVYDKTTLAFLRSYDISAQATEIAGIAYDSVTDRLYIASYVTAGVVLVYETDGTYDKTITLGAAQGAVQGITIYDGDIFLSASNQSYSPEGIYRYGIDGTYKGCKHMFLDSTKPQGICEHNGYLVTLQEVPTQTAVFLHL